MAAKIGIRGIGWRLEAGNRDSRLETVGGGLKLITENSNLFTTFH